MNEKQNNSDWLNIFSILLALQNLQENREQTKQNDVQVANDKQAKLLLDEIEERFESQNKVLYDIVECVKEIEKKLDM